MGDFLFIAAIRFTIDARHAKYRHLTKKIESFLKLKY